MHRVDAWRMIQRRAAELGMKVEIGCHTFRATGITAYLEAGGTLENAQAMAAHESPRTTKLYGRTGDETRLDQVRTNCHLSAGLLHLTSTPRKPFNQGFRFSLLAFIFPAGPLRRLESRASPQRRVCRRRCRRPRRAQGAVARFHSFFK